MDKIVEIDKIIKDMQRVMGWLEVVHKDNVLNNLTIAESKRFFITITRMTAMAEAFMKTHNSGEVLSLKKPQMICPKAAECLNQGCIAHSKHACKEHMMREMGE